MFGLDVHKAIVDNVYNNTNQDEDFKLSSYVQELIENKRNGLKSGKGGFTEDGQVYDIKTKTYRDIKKYNIPFIDKVIDEFKVGNYKEGINIIIEDSTKEGKICKELLMDYIIYSIKISKEVATNDNDCDVAMAEGFNWIPPYSLLELIGTDNCRKILENINREEDINLIKEIENRSIYRYEKFIKAKR